VCHYITRHVYRKKQEKIPKKEKTKEKKRENIKEGCANTRTRILVYILKSLFDFTPLRNYAKLFRRLRISRITYVENFSACKRWERERFIDFQLVTET